MNERVDGRRPAIHRLFDGVRRKLSERALAASFLEKVVAKASLNRCSIAMTQNFESERYGLCD
jgi:hypothetical protein